jgi:metal-responsive CopG/Arc/MetJ family transcriptional regulator
MPSPKEAEMHSTIAQEPQRGMPVQVRLQQKLLEAIENWRREQESIPSRPEAIRRLLQQSLATKTPVRS